MRASNLRTALTPALLGLLLLATGCFDDLLDDSCTRDEDCFVEQGEMCNPNYGRCQGTLVVNANNGDVGDDDAQPNNGDPPLTEVLVHIEVVDVETTEVLSNGVRVGGFAANCAVPSCETCTMAVVVSVEEPYIVCARALGYQQCRLADPIIVDGVRAEETLTIPMMKCDETSEGCGLPVPNCNCDVITTPCPEL